MRLPYGYVLVPWRYDAVRTVMLPDKCMVIPAVIALVGYHYRQGQNCRRPFYQRSEIDVVMPGGSASDLDGTDYLLQHIASNR